MKIFFLSLVALTLVSCGKGEPQDTWKAPSLYFLNSSNNKVLTKNETAGLNDYIYFSDAENQILTDIKKSQSRYSLKTVSSCIANGKSFVSDQIFNRNYVRLKEFLPTQALLNANAISCKMKFTLQNSSGSTKNYFISEKIVEIESFSGDPSLPDNVTQKTSLEGDAFSLVCEEFIIHSETSPKNVSLQELLEGFQKTKDDISVKQYKPRTNCRFLLKSKAGIQLSKIFTVGFEKLIPKYNFKIYIGWTQKRVGEKLYLYDLNLSNPHSVPISFALNKSSLKVPLSLSRKTGHHEGEDEVSSSFVGQASAINTNPNALIDKGSVFVIHLLPQESISIHATNQSECKGGRCVYSQIQIKNLPIYNLEYNYRTKEEIHRASEVQLLDQMSAN